VDPKSTSHSISTTAVNMLVGGAHRRRALMDGLMDRGTIEQRSDRFRPLADQSWVGEDGDEWGWGNIGADDSVKSWA
jgi:hypothetical protein